MIGGGALIPALLLYVIFVGAGLFAVALFIWAAVCISHRDVRRGILLLLCGSLLASPIASIILTGRLSRTKEITINRDFSQPITRLSNNARMRSLDDGRISQQLWGQLHLNISVPGGGKLIGNANNLTIITDAVGNLDILQVYYEPTLPSVVGQTVDDAFDYWEKFGKVKTKLKGDRLREISIEPFTLQLDELGGAIRFELTRDKKPPL